MSTPGTGPSKRASTGAKLRGIISKFLNNNRDEKETKPDRLADKTSHLVAESSVRTAAVVEPDVTDEPAVLQKDPENVEELKGGGKKRRTVAAVTPAERAKVLFAKHGLEVNLEDWPLPAHPQRPRVKKPIRMRRDPNRKKKKKKRGKEVVQVALPAPVEEKKKRRRKKDPYKGLTIPSRTPGGQPLVHKEIRMRRQRVKLPAEHPAQGLQKLDRVYRKPRRRVRWSCHECKTTFLDSKLCGKCSHRRCESCTRDPPKKRTDNKFGSPVSALEQKLQSTTLSD